MSGSVTVLDNNGNGTWSLSPSLSKNISTSNALGYAFSTAGTSTWEISGIRLGLKGATAGSYTVEISLYATSGNLPSGGALASASVSVTLTTTGAYYLFGATELGGLANYSMAAGGAYAVVMSGSTATGVSWVYMAAGTQLRPDPYAGFTRNGGVNTTNGGTSWTSTLASPSFTMLAEATCFLRGTLILTGRGEVPVERLRAGDLVATKFGGLRPVRWIGTQRFEGRLAGAGHQPIRFARGSLGGGMPSCDLWVSPGHAMLVGDVLVHAGALANGSTIVQEKVRGVIEYFHLDLGPHDCVLANGAWAESYFEDRNRDSFHNAAEFHARFPGHEPERQATCLPVVVVGTPAAEGLRARLAPAGVRRAA